MPLKVSQSVFDGLRICARFAFKPNALNYCGPDKNKQLFSYLEVGEADNGLRHILAEFEVMYPYLKLIALANKISDPFDYQVVQAYWLGNHLLNKVKNKELVNFLGEKIQKKLNKKIWQKLAPQAFGQGIAHHNWHVLGVTKRSAHLVIDHTLDSMNNCMIKVGEVVGGEDDYWLIKTNQLRYEKNRLNLSSPSLVQVSRSELVKNLRPGDLTALHWGEVVVKISPEQAKNLNSWTNLILANL